MRSQTLDLICAGFVIFAFVGCAQPTRADTALGDWGHYLSLAQRVYLHNPDGRAFTFTVHVMPWPHDTAWNEQGFPMRVIDPAGKVLIDGRFQPEDDRRMFDIPAGEKGAYLIEMIGADRKRAYVNFWISASLDAGVAWTGPQGDEPATGSAFEDQWFVAQCAVPRRWWFFVPEGVTDFTIKAQRDIGNTEREDPGLTVYSRRGQRMAVVFGQAVKEQRLWAGDKRWRETVEQRIPVEPGAAGRFWAVEVRNGDAHNYSKINFSLEGVPGYVARSPEEWFDPTTGRRAPVSAYDETKFMQSVPDETLRFQMWAPVPSLGDPDGIQVLGDGRFALWNSEGRALRFDIGDYLPRGEQTARVTVEKSDGSRIFDERMTVPHHHNNAREPCDMPETGDDVVTVSVSGIERWFAYTYPATPLVWLGETTDDGYARFAMEVGTARHWYFFVPAGVESFDVRVACLEDTDVAHVEVNTPDRTAALIHGHAGEATVRVPEGMDGKIWHLRTDIGSATRLKPRDAAGRVRHQGIRMHLDINGVPGRLSPTWEQWFDPATVEDAGD